MLFPEDLRPAGRELLQLLGLGPAIHHNGAWRHRHLWAARLDKRVVAGLIGGGLAKPCRLDLVLPCGTVRPVPLVRITEIGRDMRRRIARRR